MMASNNNFALNLTSDEKEELKQQFTAVSAKI